MEENVFVKLGFLELVNFLLVLTFTKSGFMKLAKYFLILVFDKSLAFLLVLSLLLVLLLILSKRSIVLKLVFNVKVNGISIL